MSGEALRHPDGPGFVVASDIPVGKRGEERPVRAYVTRRASWCTFDADITKAEVFALRTTADRFAKRARGYVLRVEAEVRP